MKRIGILPMLWLAMASVSLPARAQRLEAFEVETIVDPLALKLEEDGKPVWLDFFGTYVQTGYSEDFQAATRFSGTGVTFVDWLSTYIRRNMQISGRVTGFKESAAGASDPLRLELTAGRYFGAEKTSGTEGDTDKEPIKRLQISVVRNQGDAAIERATWSLVYELMSPGEASAPSLTNPWFDAIVRWRLSYVEGDRYRLKRRPGVEDGNPSSVWVDLPEEYQLSFEARSRTSSGWVGLAFDGGFGLGAVYREGSTRLATGRIELRVERRVLEDRLRIIGVYGPAYQFDSSAGGDRWNHEMTFYLQLPLVTKAFSTRTRGAR